MVVLEVHALQDSQSSLFTFCHRSSNYRIYIGMCLHGNSSKKPIELRFCEIYVAPNQTSRS